MTQKIISLFQHHVILNCYLLFFNFNCHVVHVVILLLKKTAMTLKFGLDYTNWAGYSFILNMFLQSCILFCHMYKKVPMCSIMNFKEIKLPHSVKCICCYLWFCSSTIHNADLTGALNCIFYSSILHKIQFGFAF